MGLLGDVTPGVGVIMVSGSCGLWAIALLISLLFIQGIYGKSLVGHTIDAGDARSKNLPSEGHLANLSHGSSRIPEIIEAHKEAGEERSLLLKLPSITVGDKKGVVGSTWNDRIKTALVSITGLIPPIEGIPVGAIISSILKIFWPDSETDIWSLIKDQVEGLVDQKILHYELQERKDEISALQKTMEMYVEAKIREKGSLMSTLLHACNELFVKLTQSSNAVQLIPLVVTHSTQHLLILKERLLHGKEMYDEDNSAVWRSDLENQISSYKNYIQDIYPKWVTWRNLKITLDVGVRIKPIGIPPFFTWRPYGIVHDEMTGQTANYAYAEFLGPNQNAFQFKCETVKKKWFSFRNGELLQILVPTFYLDNFIPGNEDNPSVIPPAMDIASFGPISPNIGGGNERSDIYTPESDNKNGGSVTSISVREFAIIDGIQVFYSTGAGTFYGNSAGGQLHEFPLNGTHIKSIQLCDSVCSMAQLTIGFSNGASSGPLGNRGGWHVDCETTGGIDTYGLHDIKALGKFVKDCAESLFQIELDYKAHSMRPSELENRELHFVDLTQERFHYKSAIDKEKSQ